LRSPLVPVPDTTTQNRAERPSRPVGRMLWQSRLHASCSTSDVSPDLRVAHEAARTHPHRNPSTRLGWAFPPRIYGGNGDTARLNRLQFELSQLLQPPCSCLDRDVPDSASFGVPVFKGCHGSDEEALFRKMLLDVSEKLTQRVFRYVFQNLPTRNQIEPDRTI